MGNIEQLIRIGGYMVGSVVLGDAIAAGDLFQQAVGGVINVGAFGWWLYSNRKAKK